MMQKLAGKDTDSTAGKSGSRPLCHARRVSQPAAAEAARATSSRIIKAAPAGAVHFSSCGLQPSRRAAAKVALQRPRRRTVAAINSRLGRRCPTEPHGRQALQHNA